MFWLPLEIYQEQTLGHPTFVIALRAKNIIAFALGKMDAWGLNNVPMTQDPWDYVHITCWNFLPFVLRRVGEAPAWVVYTTLAVVVRGAGRAGRDADPDSPGGAAMARKLAGIRGIGGVMSALVLTHEHRIHCAGIERCQRSGAAGCHAGCGSKAVGPARHGDKPVVALFHQAGWICRPAKIYECGGGVGYDARAAHAAQ